MQQRLNFLKNLLDYISMISLIYACDETGIIGDNTPYKQDIPWSLPSDLKRFKMLTVGKYCVMGRKTWESLKIKPLPNRKNIILTKDKTLDTTNWHETYQNNKPIYLSDIDYIKKFDNIALQEIVVIGGSEIYKYFLEKKYIDRIYMSKLNINILNKTYSPVYFPLESLKVSTWKEVYSEQINLSSDNSIQYTFKILDKEIIK